MRRGLVMLGAMAVVGCGPAGQGGGAAATPAPPEHQVPTVSSFTGSEVRTIEEYLREPRYQEADLRRGEVLALACRACHTLGEGQAHQIGPNLYAVFGREAAALPGFDYSEALRQTGLVWTPAALEAWLQRPSDFIPGNAMVFAGLRAEVDRRDLLAYLLRVTSE